MKGQLSLVKENVKWVRCGRVNVLMAMANCDTFTLRFFALLSSDRKTTPRTISTEDTVLTEKKFPDRLKLLAKRTSKPMYTVDFIFLRKTLSDFIKSCGGRIDLKFSGVALLNLLYSPKWKRSFFSKGKVPFSMAASLLRAVQESFSVKEIYRWKEDRFVFFMKKNYRAWDAFFFKKKSNKSGQKNWRWRSLTIFTKEATPEQGQNVWGASAAVARLDRTSLARGRAVDDHRIEFSVRSIEATAAVDRARRAQLIELAVCGRCPAKSSFLPAVTGHTWRENAPQSPPKMGVVDIARIPKAWPPRFDFGEEGRPSHDFSYFFHTFFTMGIS